MKQQILICGVGGQGIVSMSRLLGETALLLDLFILSSETHGMAQRGGIVTAHVKVGGFASPLISVGYADIIFILKDETLAQFRHFLHPNGFIIVNSKKQYEGRIISFDADGFVRSLDNPMAANIAMLGAIFSKRAMAMGVNLFCTMHEIERAMINILASKIDLLEKSINIFRKSYMEL